MTFVLDTTSRKIILDPTTGGGDLQFTASWADATATSLVEGASHGVGDAVNEVDVVAAPAASTRRIVKSITIHNANGSNLSREFILVYEDGASERIIARGTLAAGATWYSDDAAVNTVNDGDKGDITVSGAGGVWTIDNDAVTTAKVVNAAITPAKLSADAQVLAFKNRIINGSFAVNQRNVATAANDAYHFDRWYALTASGTITPTQQTNTANGIPTNIRLASSGQQFGIAQIIESINCRDLRGQSVTLSFRLRHSDSAARQIRYAILEWTGSVDAVDSIVVDTWANPILFTSTTQNVLAQGTISVSTGTSWSTVTPITATVGSSAQNLIVFIGTDEVITSTQTLDIAEVQLERGSTATEFEVLPVSSILIQCQRYFIAFTGFTGYRWFGGTTPSSNLCYVVFPVIMRVPPTGLTVPNVADFGGFFCTNAGLADIVTLTIGATSNAASIVGSTTTPTGTAGDVFFLYPKNTSAFLGFTGAEL